MGSDADTKTWDHLAEWKLSERPMDCRSARSMATPNEIMSGDPGLGVELLLAGWILSDPSLPTGTGDKAPGCVRCPISKVGAAVIMPRGAGPGASVLCATPRDCPGRADTSGLRVKSEVGSRMISPVASWEKGDIAGALWMAGVALKRGAARGAGAGVGAENGRVRGVGGGGFTAARTAGGVASG